MPTVRRIASSPVRMTFLRYRRSAREPNGNRGLVAVRTSGKVGKSSTAPGCRRHGVRSFGQSRCMTSAMSTGSVARRYRFRYRHTMAVNIRMSGDQAEGLRALAQETGRSQQDLLREALSEYVRTYRLRGFPPEVRHLLTPGRRASLQAHSRPLLLLPDGMTSDDILAEERGLSDS